MPSAMNADMIFGIELDLSAIQGFTELSLCKYKVIMYHSLYIYRQFTLIGFNYAG
ncbi:hypothetical protein SDC9_153291 [bioreactor metagenome]|uniref:Uncharacterized protein n=1 Tax=bioreactor metagenome TaxID=1076179 RepID=A0A645EVZ7_9ZZZZ